MKKKEERTWPGQQMRAEEKGEPDTLEAKYRLTLLSPLGRQVLSDILIGLCNFGCYLESPEEVAQYNVGIGILSRCGIISAGNREAIIEALCNVMPAKSDGQEG